ncbi:MAG: hypothetical protein ABR530_01740, partial [Pyrinomonadaceae bacterium]
MTDPDTLNQHFIYERRSFRPTTRTWIKHILLLLVTLCTATIAGSMFPFGLVGGVPAGDPQTLPEFIRFFITLPLTYSALIGETIHQLLTNWQVLRYGLSFSLSLLFILISH